MMLNPQGFANQSSSYKKLTLEKDPPPPERIRRGRSCTRKEKRETNPETRILRDRLAAFFAQKEYKKELKAFEKSLEGTKGLNVEIPDNVKQLKNAVNFHRANLETALIAQEARSKFPPLS